MLPPASMLTLLRMIAPAAGSPPIAPTAMLAAPCAIISRVRLRRLCVISSTCEAPSAVCRPAMNAITTANFSTVQM